MSFLDQLQKQKNKLSNTETVVTNVDGTRFVEKSGNKVNLPNSYGFVVDHKPDDVPALVIDHLYIGSQDCTARSVLQSHDIRSVLSLGIEVPVDEVSYRFVPCLDIPETDIKPILRECLPYIHEAIENKSNILVHCNAGVSRTSMVAIGYLMQYNGMDFSKAYDFVKSKRPAVQPNPGFAKQLKAMLPGNLIT